VTGGVGEVYLEGGIDGATADRLVREVTSAAEDGARVLLMTIDSEGGHLECAARSPIHAGVTTRWKRYALVSFAPGAVPTVAARTLPYRLPERPGTTVNASPVLGGLHHDYRLAA
jgi:hypothetical protein